MKIPQKAANNLLDALAIVAINAKGIPFTEEEVEKINFYTREKFASIMIEWEEITGEKWEIIPEKIKGDTK